MIITQYVVELSFMGRDSGLKQVKKTVLAKTTFDAVVAAVSDHSPVDALGSGSVWSKGADPPLKVSVIGNKAAGTWKITIKST